ncbi:MAG: polyphosphate kinase 2 family protein [Phycisphaerales bacterium]|nr:polyphosphate kinase 2 family protein [Phycisphaerales bacterium]
MDIRVEKFIAPFRVDSGKGFRLKDYSTKNTNGFKDKEAAGDLLAKGVEWMSEQQEMMYAQDQYSMLLIFQAMDAAGKDGTIKHVMSGINPQGCQVYSFKQPTSEELDHDFLWRFSKRMPERGRIGIFNRSYYEDVLVVRVHPELLTKSKLPPEAIGKNVWAQRFESINAFEEHHTRQGTVIRKFFLHVSRDEQKRRLLSRLEEKSKNWKFAAADIAERAHWDDYQAAYEDAIKSTATKHAPWFIVPADHKWFTRLVVAAAIVDAFADLKLKFPEVDKSKRKELKAIEESLKRER